MKKENQTRRGQLRGYIFEVVIRKLLSMNGFEQIVDMIPNKVKIHGVNNIEIKGRGTWHQIDCPCIYKKTVPFIHDIRLLAEIKFHTSEIQKDKIRQYIGVMKDISENYFIDEINTIENQKKYTDIGVFFAANGFQIEAEKLAFAHGIKTISYKNNEIVQKIKDNITLLESDYLSANKCISKDNQNSFMSKIAYILDNPISERLFIEFEEEFMPENGYRDYLIEIRNELQQIHTSFFGITETNYFIHFLSKARFPSNLFSETDTMSCRVFYVNSQNFYITINGDDQNRRFYFSAPEKLIRKVLTDREGIIDEKGRHFNKITVSIELNGILRNLSLHIDRDWLNRLAREI
ncbi:MAG: hypothetical protein KKD05_06475 [Candidatus Omnitrophica bacterium]|nr:hypothetical protein [Candidatus Omnitrophota bacterium]